jgi:hypothetical protein
MVLYNRLLHFLNNMLSLVGFSPQNLNLMSLVSYLNYEIVIFFKNHAALVNIERDCCGSGV